MANARSKDKWMRNTYRALLALLAALMCAAVASAQITTVILSDKGDATFELQDSHKTQRLVFSLDPVALPQDARVTQCELRVVIIRPKKATGQDVAVLASDNKQIGELHLSDQDTSSSYRTPLRPQSCEPNNKLNESKSFTMTLESKSKNTGWTYYGSGAPDAADQPRLIVTYNSDSRPSPGRSGQSTDWKYSDPNLFFSSTLGPGQSLLANPVSYAGAVYVVANSALYRVAGAHNVTSWKLNFAITKKSFAFVTAWGRLQIITENAIHNCDLTTLVGGDTLVCASTPAEEITVGSGETPAMGPDGSLYFKNVQKAGSFVARNPMLKEIWRTDLKLTAISSITISANGQYAYALVNIAPDSPIAASMTVLLRIDTATGELVKQEIQTNTTEPQLKDLFQPAVVSKVINNRNVDYVFVAGNTSDKGLLQLIAFEPGTSPSVVWTRSGKIASAPVPSVVNGDTLFVVQGGKLKRYPWFSGQAGSMGAKRDSEMEEAEKTVEAPPLDLKDGATLLVDGGDSVYVYAANGALYAFQNDLKKMPPAQQTGAGRQLLFTTSGALIGYDGTNVYDLSPKAGANISPSALATWTIYSANTVTAPASPGVKAGDRVTLKGNTITLPNGFGWPLGASLSLQSVQ